MLNETTGAMGLSGVLVGDRTTGAIDWNAIINQSFALGSHAISAYSGQNSGTQIGYNPTQGGVFAIQQSQPAYGGAYYGGAQTYTPAQLAAMQAGGVGGTVGSGLDGIFNWLMANPVITFGGVAALYLLFREPPRRR